MRFRSLRSCRPNSLDKRILIIGAPASGKTWLARKMAKQMSIAHIEVDRLYWVDKKGGRIHPEFERQLQEKLRSHRSWILEGLLKHTLAVVEAQLTHVLYLKPSLAKLWWRSLSRFARQGNLTELKMNFSPVNFRRRMQIYERLRAQGVEDYRALGYFAHEKSAFGKSERMESQT